MSEETVKVIPYHDKTRTLTVEISVAELEALGFTRTVVKPWKPEVSDDYWFISAYNLISSSIWYDTEVFWCYWEAGNCYQTEAEAIKARDKQLATVRVLRRLRELEGDWVAVWSDNNQQKYHPCYNYSSRLMEVIRNYINISVPAEWYSTKEAWEQVVEELESDVKLMMGVVG